jgi:hypothetical protein
MIDDSDTPAQRVPPTGTSGYARLRAISEFSLRHIVCDLDQVVDLATLPMMVPPGGSVDGCEALSRIVLTSTSPLAVLNR